MSIHLHLSRSRKGVLSFVLRSCTWEKKAPALNPSALVLRKGGRGKRGERGVRIEKEERKKKGTDFTKEKKKK